MIATIVLLLAFQLPGVSSHEAERMEEMRRIEELRDESKFRLARQKEAEYKSKVLYNAHYNFVVKFNAYLSKYLQGLNPTKEKKAAMKAFEELRKTEGFQ